MLISAVRVDSNSEAMLMLKHLGEVRVCWLPQGRSYHYYGVALYDESSGSNSWLRLCC